ncbi:MAG: glycosyltransferase family 2 protein [Candidatus Latescibacteria bacterium]|nr:glycosyltransferase family 2 protein [Candidatus Latescibacterota bacterium]MBT5830192.1 glycosyltransferase family 2 protein [Candidatus Latescibacterota bacterium]
MTPDINTDGPGLVSIIIPAYNEENAIVETIEQVRAVMSASQYDYELIIVNDGSTDQTGEKARIAGARVLNHEVNQGYGAGLKTGIVAAQGDWIVITDADGTYPNERIPDLLSEAGPNDMVVGARVGEAAKIPLIRRPAKWVLAQFANYLAETKIPDYNSGLRVFRKDVAKRFFKILPQGFSFTTTITLSSLCNGYRVKYIPIAYYERTGKSKIKPIRDTYRFFMLILRTTVYFNPMKVFMPISFILFSMGIAKLAHEIYTAGGLAETSVFLILASFQMAALGLLADMIDKRL